MNNSNPPLELNKRAFEEVALAFPGSNPALPRELRTRCNGREFLDDGDGGDEGDAITTHAGTRRATDTSTEKDEAENTFVHAITTRVVDLEVGVEVGSVETDEDEDMEAKTDAKDFANTFANPFADISQDKSTEATVEAEAEKEAEAEDFEKGFYEVGDTRFNTSSAGSTDWAKAWTDTEDKDGQSRKRRKIKTSKDPPAATLEDIGPMIDFGGTGQLLKYKSGLVLKIYVDSTTFHTEFRAYSQLAASSSPHPISHVIESALLPQSFLNKQRRLGNNKYKARVFTPYRYGLVLQHFRGPLLSDFLDEDSVREYQVDRLQQEIRSAVQTMHEQGISHGDIKGNNIMFRSQDFKNTLHSPPSTPKPYTHLQVKRNKNHVTETCENTKDWRIFDFGEAVFRSDCSSEDWNEECRVELIRIDDMFKFKRAQLAIDLLGQYITPKVNSIPQDKIADVESQDNCFLDSFYDNNQDDLLSTLRAAEGYSTSASPLVRLLIPRIPSPSLDLIETIANIFCKGNEPKQALNYLTIQIETSQQQQQNCNSCSNEASSMFLHSKRLYVARKYYHQSTHHVAALEAFLPVVENRFGIASVRALEIKRELSLIMYDRGDKEQARILYREAVMVLEGMKEVGKDQGEEKDGGSDKGGCLQVKDQHSESPTERMGIKSTLRKWDKILVEREELDRKRAALWGRGS
ncbi:hypothetical protein BKA61DRAFT_672572 [Leptodontidium sp. MPI-SDFR-AT-0119]|nr:hypothetical protein BKA61DRAFT_672572 [Leptodontidium sp. MPI-SDFR-AT-0119]